jgi:hypothetical protein
MVDRECVWLRRRRALTVAIAHCAGEREDQFSSQAHVRCRYDIEPSIHYRKRRTCGFHPGLRSPWRSS